MMTEQEKIELSQRVAEKYGIAPNRLIGYSDDFLDEKLLWLYQDTARTIELAIEHEVGLRQVPQNDAVAYYFKSVYGIEMFSENPNNHPSKKEAGLVAVLRALESKE